MFALVQSLSRQRNAVGLRDMSRIKSEHQLGVMIPARSVIRAEGDGRPFRLIDKKEEKDQADVFAAANGLREGQVLFMVREFQRKSLVNDSHHGQETGEKSFAGIHENVSATCLCREHKERMSLRRKSKTTQIEILMPDAVTVELRLYEGLEDRGYLSWKMSRPVAMLIALWWKYRKSDSERAKGLPKLIISMPSSGLVDVKELDALGHPKQAGWSLPVSVVEALAKKLP